jgi:hypothetical protein
MVGDEYPLRIGPGLPIDHETCHDIIFLHV